jgi:hypothetical protein
VDCRNPAGCFAPAVATFLTPAQVTLGNAQLLKTLAQPARVINCLTVAKGQQVIQANVNSHRQAGLWPWLRVGNIQHKGDVPLVQAALENNVLYRRAFRQRPVQLHLHIAGTLHVQPVAVHFAAIAMAVFQALKTAARFEAGLARFLARLDTTKEGGESFIQAAQHLLCAGSIQKANRIRKIIAGLFESRPLLLIGDTTPTTFSGPTTLVQRVVVDGAHLPEHKVKRFLLPAIGVKPILVAADHLTTFLLVIVARLFWNIRGFSPGGRELSCSSMPHSPPR